MVPSRRVVEEHPPMILAVTPSFVHRVAAPQVYLHADIRTKEKALARTRPTGTRPGRYRPQDDKLLAFLKAL
jgi:hypothetical protein